MADGRIRHLTYTLVHGLSPFASDKNRRWPQG
jgi:hypothetical protein